MQTCHYSTGELQQCPASVTVINQSNGTTNNVVVTLTFGKCDPYTCAGPIYASRGSSGFYPVGLGQTVTVTALAVYPPFAVAVGDSYYLKACVSSYSWTPPPDRGPTQTVALPEIVARGQEAASCLGGTTIR